MGNFERLSVLVIVVIIVLIVVIALVQLTSDGTDPGAETPTLLAQSSGGGVKSVELPAGPAGPRPFSEHVERNRPAPPAAPPATPPTEPEPAPKPVEPEPARPVEPKVHVVQPGQTIGKIARVYFPTSVTKGTDAILKANPQVDPMRMAVGTKLVIPAMDGMSPTPVNAIERPTPAPASQGGLASGGTYVTKRGDTLAAISQRAYGRTDRWQDIWLANYEALGDNVDRPLAGTRLRLP